MYNKIKRMIDFILALTLLFLLSPLFVMIIIAIKTDSKGTAVFKQKRFGKSKTFFNILKFRTMKVDAPKDMPTHLFANSETYITNIGKFLRKTSLDELPQLINILKGDMSFVGPRPALWNQEDLIAERDKYGANEVIPGLTGWAQINGRDELPIDVKAKDAGEYVKNNSLWFDYKCFVKAFSVVLTCKGVKEGEQRIVRHS